MTQRRIAPAGGARGRFQVASGKGESSRISVPRTQGLMGYLPRADSSSYLTPFPLWIYPTGTPLESFPWANVTVYR